MNIKKVYKLLTDLEIPTIATETSIEQAAGQGENIYRLIKRNNKWEFLFVEYEKQNGKEHIEKVFDDEDTASRYYYFYQLDAFFYRKYVRPFKIKNDDLNMWDSEFSMENLSEALHRAGINHQYYSLDGNVKNHSFFLDRINDQESKVKFVNGEGNILGETLVLENWRAYNSLFQDVYGLSLLDQYCQKLIDYNEIDQPFTDEDYKMFLLPNS